MMTIADQPSPVATSRRPTWDIVASYVAQLWHESAYGSTGVLTLVLSDMRERDGVGRERYGVPLTSGNGRDHLIDAYQELLDSCVYLATELDEHGVGPWSTLDEGHFVNQKLRWRLHCVQQLFASQVRASIQLRALIEERTS